MNGACELTTASRKLRDCDFPLFALSARRFAKKRLLGKTSRLSEQIKRLGRGGKEKKDKKIAESIQAESS
jgi:hypothetical protein